jgi:hypothetical protein
MDFVFSWLVFQHIADTQTVLRYCVNMAKTLRRHGVVMCQLLANDERPNNPLWVWHDPQDVQSAMIQGGCTNVHTSVVDENSRWIIVRGTKDGGDNEL